jgi:O-antigen/teichoic acid export membrane protein
VPDARAFAQRFSAAVFGNAVYSACQWAIIVALARLGTMEAVGLYALAHSVCAPLFYLFGLSLVNVISTDAKSEYSPSEYLGVRSLGSGLAFLVSTVISLLMLPMVSGFVWIVLVIAAAKSLDGFAEVAIGYLRGVGSLRRVAGIQLTNGIASLTLTVAFLLVHRSAFSAAAGFLGGSILGAAAAAMLARGVLQVREAVQGLSRVRPGRLRTLFQKAFPLGCSGALSLGAVHIPRFALAKSAGSAALGLYAAASQPMLAAGVLVSSLAESVIGDLSRQYHDGQFVPFKATIKWLVVMAAVVSIVGIVVAVPFSDVILSMLYGASYAEAGTTFVVLAISVGLRSISALLGTMLASMRLFTLNMWFKVAGSVVTILSSVPLVAAYGMLGAALAVFCGAIVETAVAAVMGREVVRQRLVAS